jgi:hypothetical protein
MIPRGELRIGPPAGFRRPWHCPSPHEGGVSLRKAWCCSLLTCVVLLVGGAACGGPSDSRGEGAPADNGPRAIVPPPISCAFELRNVRYCGGSTVVRDWAKACQGGQCPVSLDSHHLSFPDPAGTGLCSEGDEYRHVLDFAGSCSDWEKQGEPVKRAAPLACGHSLYYNLSSTDCQNCISQYCSNEKQACHGGTRCYALVGCLIACTNDSTETYNTCLQTYSDAVSAANAFGTCLSNSCSDVCD